MTLTDSRLLLISKKYAILRKIEIKILQFISLYRNILI